MEDMPSETISKIHLVDLAGRFVTHLFTFLVAVFLLHFGSLVSNCIVSAVEPE